MVIKIISLYYDLRVCQRDAPVLSLIAWRISAIARLRKEIVLFKPISHLVNKS